uniref:AB hydrolase-1 domain-containing protein n=1 Tax=Anolis carolinensis TaxID=28377 RepID=A0A803THL0_ANOCA
MGAKCQERMLPEHGWKHSPPSASFPSLACRPVPVSYCVFDGASARPPLVLLHGLFGNKGNFASLAKAIVRRTLLTVRKFFLMFRWNLLSCSLKPLFPCVLVRRAAENKLAPSSL